MNAIDKINKFGWADWFLGPFCFDDDRLFIKLSYDTGTDYNSNGTLKKDGERYAYATICCNHFIGFIFVGCWDESIIEDINVESEGDLIVDSVKKVKCLHGGAPFPDAEKDIDGQWYQLNIKLIDGNVIKIACKDFEIEVQ